MEKNTLTTFLWVVVTVIIMLALIAFAAPFGMYVKNNIEVFSNDIIVEEPENDLYEAENYTITIQYICASCKNATPGQKTCGLHHPDTVIKGTAGTVYSVPNPEIQGYTPVSGSALKGVYGEKDETIIVEYSPNTYQINYELDGWEWKNGYLPVIEYIYNHEDAVALPTAEVLMKEYHQPLGKWYTSKLFVGDGVTELATNIPYDQTVYWGGTKGNAYTITYDFNDNSSQLFYTNCGNSICVNKGTHKGKWVNNESPKTTYNHGDQTTLPTNVEKVGYVFRGWSTSATQFVQKTQINESDHGNIKVYAFWDKKSYKIEYEMKFKILGNGDREKEEITATFNTTDIVRQYTYTESTRNGKIVLPTANKINPFVDDNNKPVGFHLEPGANGWANVWKDKDGIPVTNLPNSGDCYYPVGDILLYINPIVNTYTIHFDSNPPSAITNVWGYTNMSPWVSGETKGQTLNWNDKKALSKNGFTITGYTFAGWATSKNGNVKYEDEEEVAYLTPTDNGDYYLYAKWTPNTNLTVTIRHHYQTDTAAINNLTTINSTNFVENTGEKQTISGKTVNTNFSISNYKKNTTGFTFYQANATVKGDTLQITDTVWISPDGLEINIYYLRNKNTVNVHINRRDAFVNLSYKIESSNGTTLASGDLEKGIYNNNKTTKDYTISNVPYGATVKITHEVRSKCDVTSSNISLKANKKDVTKTYTESGGTNQTGVVSFKMPNAITDYTINAQWQVATVNYVIEGTANGCSLSYYSKTCGLNDVIPFPTVSTNGKKATVIWTDKNDAEIVPTASYPTVTYEMLGTTITYKATITINHSYVWVTTKHPTCTTTGEQVHKCKTCGDIGEKKPIAALGHDTKTEVTTAGTHCDSPGKSKDVCQRKFSCSCGCWKGVAGINQSTGKCEHTENEKTLNAKGHSTEGRSQCDKVHNADHKYLVNIYGHKCTSGKNENNRVSNCCWRHVICGNTLSGGARCNHNLQEKFCMTHGTGTAVSHGVTGCKKHGGSSSHTCKTHAYREEVDTLPCPNSGQTYRVGKCGVCNKDKDGK